MVNGLEEDAAPLSIAHPVAAGLYFYSDPGNVQTLTQIDQDLDKLNFGMASLAVAPVSGTVSDVALGARGLPA